MDEFLKEITAMAKRANELYKSELLIDVDGINPSVLLYTNEQFLEMFPSGYEYKEYTDQDGYFWEKYSIVVDGVRFCSSHFSRKTEVEE